MLIKKICRLIVILILLVEIGLEEMRIVGRVCHGNKINKKLL
jgi:hypothetical protein